jgi:hypothetical protein
METTTDGDQAAHSVHFFTIGIGGDGLRGPDPGLENRYGLFMADRDSPESYDADGVLQDGGKHYGHLLVDVSLRDDGQWEATIKPVYAFPLLNAQGEVQTFEPRVYDDALTLTSQHAD